MALVGVLARIEHDRRDSVWKALEADPALTPFRIEDDDRLGVLIEAPDLDGAHEILTTRLDVVEGVLGSWPVYMHQGDPDGDAVPTGESEGEK